MPMTTTKNRPKRWRRPIISGLQGERGRSASPRGTGLGESVGRDARPGGANMTRSLSDRVAARRRSRPIAAHHLIKHPKHDDLTPMTKAMPLVQIRRQARASVRHRLGSHGTPPLNIHQKHQSVPGLATDVTSPRGWVILDASCRPAVSAERSSSMRRLLPPCLDAVR
jgi:hypothetical protein